MTSIYFYFEMSKREKKPEERVKEEESVQSEDFCEF